MSTILRVTNAGGPRSLWCRTAGPDGDLLREIVVSHRSSARPDQIDLISARDGGHDYAFLFLDCLATSRASTREHGESGSILRRARRCGVDAFLPRSRGRAAIHSRAVPRTRVEAAFAWPGDSHRSATFARVVCFQPQIRLLPLHVYHRNICVFFLPMVRPRDSESASLMRLDAVHPRGKNVVLPGSATS